MIFVVKRCPDSFLTNMWGLGKVEFCYFLTIFSPIGHFYIAEGGVFCCVFCGLVVVFWKVF